MKNRLNSINTTAFILIILCYVVLISCNQSFGPEKYKAWLENPENGLKKIIVRDSLTYELQYKTPEYIAISSNSNEDIDKSTIDQEVASLKGFLYFNLRVKDKENRNAFMFEGNTSIKDYVYFSMQNDLSLCSGADTLPCVQYQFEGHGGITPDIVLIAFPCEETVTKKGFTILYRSRLFSDKPVIFEFPKESFINIPKLNL